MGLDWFDSWFDSRYYHILYDNRNDKEANGFLDHLMSFLSPATSSKLLDLGCGKGRHSVYLNKKGYNIKGIDLSRESIQYAQQFSNDQLSFEVGDMRSAIPDHTYDYVLSLFTSFGYFEDERDDIRVAESIFNGLKPGGTFVLDFLNIKHVKKHLIPHTIVIKQNIEFLITKTIAFERVVKAIAFTDEDHSYYFEEKVRAYNKSELEKMLYNVGFSSIQVFGSYQLNTFDAESSDRLILICRK